MVDQAFSVGNIRNILNLFCGLPKEQIGADGRAEYANY
jgi:hypothetical protein